ncbi:hypothetical protein [Paraherbaspirillum soli]|uniref:Uncharacterized protein n=1 Tax=Paraherbaspirillum soli TaxID=631222 RepID=A0ABW0MA80_9BURK
MSNVVINKHDIRNQYAAEMSKRFEEFTTWAISNWPVKNVPLMATDFAECHKEIAKILGPRLGDSNDPDDLIEDKEYEPQYINVTPMPWP